MNNEICHVPNEVSSETNVEEHEEHVEQLLPCILCMQVPITDCSECGDGPIHSISIA